MAKPGQAKHLGFSALAAEIEQEYLKKGYSAAEAKRIGQETAAKVARGKGMAPGQAHYPGKG